MGNHAMMLYVIIGSTMNQNHLRLLLDDISNLRAAIQHSLSAGILPRRSIKVSFHRHVFNFLFKNKGRNVKHKPGKMYSKSDFPSYFDENFFQYYNKFGEGCFIVFPIYMYSCVRFTPKSYNSDKRPLCCSFNEILMLKVVKER